MRLRRRYCGGSNLGVKNAAETEDGTESNYKKKDEGNWAEERVKINERRGFTHRKTLSLTITFRLE
jgi:hypothetical protein